MNSKRRMFIRMVGASLVRRRSRMIVALLAIIVGATILSGLEMIYYDVPRQMSAEFRSYGANMILAPAGEGSIEKEDVAAALATLPENVLEGSTPYRYENTQSHNMPVTLAGTTFDSVLRTSPYWHVEGELPTGDGEALIGAKTAEKLGLKVGDELTCMSSFEVTEEMDASGIPEEELYSDPETGEIYCDHILRLKLTGLLETGGSEEEYIYVTLADAEYISLTERGYDIVEVSVAGSAEQLTEYMENMNARGSSLTARMVKRVTASEGTVMTKLQALVFIVTAVVLVLTMICVATTMTAVIAERRKEIGLRKALGAENKSIIGQFLTEGLLLGGIGGILGAVLGYFFAQYVSMQVFGSSITFRPLLIPVTVVASVVVTGVSCLFPIRNAVEVDPALVLKGE